MQLGLPIKECNCTIYKEDAVAFLPKSKKKIILTMKVINNSTKY